jgi:streptogramin lyase
MATRPGRTIPGGAGRVTACDGQLELALLTDDELATIDAARVAADRAVAAALAARRFLEADEQGRLATQLERILIDQAARRRASKA